MNRSARSSGPLALVPRTDSDFGQPTPGQSEPPAYTLGGPNRRVMAAGVLAFHLLLGWALLQFEQLRHAVMSAAPIMVRLLPLPPPSTPPATTAQLKAPDLPQRSVLQVPPPRFEITQPLAAPTITVAVMTPVVTPETVVTAPRASSAPMVAQLAPVTPSLKRIAPGAVRYRVEPRMVMPLMSRRLRESGIVYLLIAVDARGVLMGATVQKSSGFARLDAQALQDIRTARFVPQTENGQPIEWEMVAPLSYELE